MKQLAEGEVPTGLYGFLLKDDSFTPELVSYWLDSYETKTNPEAPDRFTRSGR